MLADVRDDRVGHRSGGALVGAAQQVVAAVHREVLVVVAVVGAGLGVRARAEQRVVGLATDKERRHREPLGLPLIQKDRAPISSQDEVPAKARQHSSSRVAVRGRRRVV